MAFEYRVEPLPEVWPGVRTKQRRASPFKSNWGSTLVLLGAELKQLGARDVVLRLAVRADHIRGDGGVYAKARIQDPSVVLECKVGADRLSFPCDRFNWWEDNVRAIALALEALRKVDRYGVRAGKQYEGFKALPGGMPMPAATLTLEDAAQFLYHWTEGSYDPEQFLRSADIARIGVRYAAKMTHPDNQHTGSTERFQKLQDVKALLSKRHGVTL